MKSWHRPPPPPLLPPWGRRKSAATPLAPNAEGEGENTSISTSTSIFRYLPNLPCNSNCYRLDIVHGCYVAPRAPLKRRQPYMMPPHPIPFRVHYRLLIGRSVYSAISFLKHPPPLPSRDSASSQNSACRGKRSRCGGGGSGSNCPSNFETKGAAPLIFDGKRFAILQSFLGNMLFQN